MDSDPADALFPLLLRDAIALFGAREDINADVIAAFAKRRAPVYVQPGSDFVGDAYWISLAAALAPIGPPTWMPMSALVESGITLEGAARGLRGLIFREHSDRERRRVQKTATLAARIMEIVASANRAIGPEEHRRMEMAMASFGLSSEELARTRPTTPITFDNLEIFGELDARTRRDLLRGAWQLALVDHLDPSRDVVVRGIAARLELSTEYDTLRAEVVEQQARQFESATAAVVLTREVLRACPEPDAAPWIPHLLDAIAPPAQRAALTSTVSLEAPTVQDAVNLLDTPRRKQVFALAVATVSAPDPPLSSALHRAVALRELAERAGARGEAETAIARVESFVGTALAAHTASHAAASTEEPAAKS